MKCDNSKTKLPWKKKKERKKEKKAAKNEYKNIDKKFINVYAPIYSFILFVTRYALIFPPYETFIFF